ncbi:MarR family winged helix-turn-helix transcriptional regulator [Marinitenerispora sediminis]|uniref:MarR family transcriptional regulator n=1 Tax=Marinitenerispora sediminis TaxID=1931232 RepID=A0A368T3K8_9ACTN|nr:MarR family transcriptional regulator [Marinitenerispora sediminis]RCV49387.1 MarR family transcriptional regulator [Marinitenerispora sediminis]RCV51978.1 MarR family transcriptional regulator [Marinitenerispora sediminis]RCV52099.1 MarR family transcriptional regulator [Marinitenerispora sediminis]
MDGQRPDARRLAVWRDFLQGHSLLMVQLERELKDGAGLSLAEYDVLLRLREAPGRRMRMSDLSVAVLYTTGGLTRLVDRMAQASLVTREPAPGDRRGVYAVLTDTGVERLAEAAAVHLAGVQRNFAALLPDRELDQVAGFLARLAPGGAPEEFDACGATAVAAAVEAGSHGGRSTRR